MTGSTLPAMLFPGQGSQVVGMGADLVEHDAGARQRFEEAEDQLGFPLRRLCFEGPLEALTETRHAQPALLTHSTAVLDLLRRHGVEPAVVAGHSLGEYSALVAAGVLTFADALRLVQERGRLMYASGLQEPGTMAAVVGLDVEAVERVCVAARRHGVCDLANLNTDDQIVISGSVAAVEAALPELEAAGARRVVRLNVSGAFHSALMEGPARELASHLEACAFADARAPVIPNVTAQPESRGVALRQLLERQIVSPVRWAASMRQLAAMHRGAVIEVGPGNVLKGLLRRVDRTLSCTSLGRYEDVMAWLEGHAARP